MPLPVDLETVTVSLEYLGPSGTPLAGYVEFVPEPARLTSPDEDVIMAGPVRVTLVNGAGSVELLATDATGVDPTGWTYRVYERFLTAPQRDYAISLPKAAPTVELADLAPTSAAAGSYVLVPGPAGPAGPAGATGATGASGSLPWARITSSPQGAVSVAPTFVATIDVEWTAIASTEFAGLEVDGTDVTVDSGTFLVSWSGSAKNGTFNGALFYVSGSNVNEDVRFQGPSPSLTFHMSAAPRVVTGPATLTLAAAHDYDFTDATFALTIVKIA